MKKIKLERITLQEKLNFSFTVKYKRLLLVLLYFSFFNLNSQESNKDISIYLDKEVFNKVLSKAKYPIILMEKNNPGPPESFVYKSDFVMEIDETDAPLFLYTEEEANEIYSWAVDDEINNNLNESTFLINDNDFKSNVTRSWNLLRKDAEDVLKEYEEFKKAKRDSTIDNSIEWIWPENLKESELEVIAYGTFEKGIEQLNKQNIKGFKVGAKLKYLKVQVPSPPNIQFKSPTFQINQMVVKTTATGELWAKIPKIRCVKRCRIGPIKFCCGWKLSWVWRKVAQATISPLIKANANITFLTPNNEKILAKGKFTRLRLDHFILRKIPLRGIANRYIKDLKLEIFDVKKWLLSVPIIDTNIGVKKITLPPNDKGVEIIVELN